MLIQVVMLVKNLRCLMSWPWGACLVLSSCGMCSYKSKGCFWCMQSLWWILIAYVHCGLISIRFLNVHSTWRCNGTPHCVILNHVNFMSLKYWWLKLAYLKACMWLEEILKKNWLHFNHCFTFSRLHKWGWHQHHPHETWTTWVLHRKLWSICIARQEHNWKKIKWNNVNWNKNNFLQRKNTLPTSNVVLDTKIVQQTQSKEKTLAKMERGGFTKKVVWDTRFLQLGSQL